MVLICAKQRPSNIYEAQFMRKFSNTEAGFFQILSWRRPLSYRNQSMYLLPKSMDWFLYDNGLRHERVKQVSTPPEIIRKSMVF